MTLRPTQWRLYKASRTSKAASAYSPSQAQGNSAAINFLFFFGLYLFGYGIISHFKKRAKDEDLATDADEAIVYRISLWLSSFSLAVSIASALLLPLSIASNEIVVQYPNSYYVQWLNTDLIHSLWNLIFLFSNGSLFVLLPFAYFFIESEGLPHRKGITARVQETLLLLVLLSIIVMGLVVTLSALLDRSQATFDLLFNMWDSYLPFLYSCVSFCGVLMLLLCTPVGLAHLFTVVSNLLVKPYFLRDLDDDLNVARFEMANLQRKLAVYYTDLNSTKVTRSSLSKQLMSGMHSVFNERATYLDELKKKIKLVKEDITRLEKHKQSGRITRNLFYPLAMIGLFTVTTVTILLVTLNTLQLLVGIKSLPQSTQEQFALGISSLSVLGSTGAYLEILIIFYLMATTLVGLYTLPLIKKIRPRKMNTPITHIILDCGFVLILSSALPLLARTLGITNFDLLGDFGRIRWLGNFYIILAYNILFAVLSGLCIAKTFTVKVRKELFL
ncbi:hypothetical protein QYM36_016698, partial [Artemia franciscana]